MTRPRHAAIAQSRRKITQLVLSIFPGIDLLGRGFEAEGFCVVRGPDLIWGGDIRAFHPPRGKFDGITGGSPCQEFSRQFRGEPTGEGVEMLAEFARVIEEAEPKWFLLENVPTVPDLELPGYFIQRIDVDGRECGLKQRRCRHFQFGSGDGWPLAVTRRRLFVTDQAAAMASEGRRAGRRDWPAFCRLQGLEPIDLPGMTLSARYRAVGNGVPIPMARLMARAIAEWSETGCKALKTRVGLMPKLCECNCAREVGPNQLYALPCCRKRMQRRREALSGRDDAAAQKNGRVTVRA